MQKDLAKSDELASLGRARISRLRSAASALIGDRVITRMKVEAPHLGDPAIRQPVISLGQNHVWVNHE
jgi:hypothetical protein